MSDWVERIGGGYVNLAVASELDSGQDSMGRHYLVRDSHGEALGRIHATDADCESLDAARAHAAERIAAHERIEAAQRQREAAKAAKGTKVAGAR